MCALRHLQWRWRSDGPVTQLNNWINGHMAAGYDAFPSLHVLVTGAVLVWDFRRFRWRFNVMILPSLVMLVSTIALRFHYAIDVLVSLCALVVLAGVARSEAFERPVTEPKRLRLQKVNSTPAHFSSSFLLGLTCELDAGERVQWIGKPSKRHLSLCVLDNAADPLLLFMFMAFFVMTTAGRRPDVVWLALIQFAVGFIWLLLSFRRDVPLRYVVTSKRCIIEYGPWASKDRRTTKARAFSRTRVDSWRCSVPSGRGDLVFFKERVRRGRRNRIDAVGFLGLEDVTTIAEMLGVDPKLPVQGVALHKAPFVDDLES